MPLFRPILLLVTVLTLSLTRFAVANPDGTILIELNKLEPRDSDCQAYLVLENGTPDHFIQLKFELVIFRQDGIIDRIVAVPVGPLPSGKTRVKAFNLGLSCDQIGQLLLNHVPDCTDRTGSRSDCMSLLSTQARTAVPLAL